MVFTALISNPGLYFIAAWNDHSMTCDLFPVSGLPFSRQLHNALKPRSNTSAISGFSYLHPQDHQEMLELASKVKAGRWTSINHRHGTRHSPAWRLPPLLHRPPATCCRWFPHRGSRQPRLRQRRYVASIVKNSYLETNFPLKTMESQLIRSTPLKMRI